MVEINKINYSIYLTGFIPARMLLVIISTKKTSGRFGRKKKR